MQKPVPLECIVGNINNCDYIKQGNTLLISLFVFRCQGGEIAVYDKDRLECIVGDNIQMYRKMRKLTQDALAEIIDIDRAAISHYESGTNGMMGIHDHANDLCE